MEKFDFNSHITKVVKPKVELLYPEKEKFYAYFTKLLNSIVITQSNGKRSLEINEEFGKQLMQIYRYINRDQELENEKTNFGRNWNLDAGLLLMGNFGTGKTLILKGIYELMKDQAKKGKLIGIQGRYITARQISTCYQFTPKEIPTLIGKPENDIFIDELGDEPLSVSNYGTSESPVYAVLKQKLDDWDNIARKPRLFTTTNLSKKEITDRYHERVWSRMVSSTNILILGGGNDSKDMRKA
jgi:Cdc6-like AAA superfamily ATPase